VLTLNHQVTLNLKINKERIMKILYARFGKRIRDKRNSIGMSQETLAEKCEVSSSYMGLVERGERKPSLEIVVRIANTLDVTPGYLLFDSIEQRRSDDKDMIVGMLNDFDNEQIKMAYQIVNQIHSYINGKGELASLDEIDKMLDIDKDLLN